MASSHLCPVKHQLVGASTYRSKTDLFAWLKDELVFVQQVFDLPFAFGLVIGKPILTNHMACGDLLDVGPILRDAYTELTLALVFVRRHMYDLPSQRLPSE